MAVCVFATMGLLQVGSSPPTKCAFITFAVHVLFTIAGWAIHWTSCGHGCVPMQMPGVFGSVLEAFKPEGALRDAVLQTCSYCLDKVSLPLRQVLRWWHVVAERPVDSL